MQNPEKQSKSAWTTFIRDGDGHLALFQSPNFPLIGWFASMVISKFVRIGPQHITFDFLSSAFLFTWAYLEITKGASYFRRLLGLVVFLGIIISHFR